MRDHDPLDGLSAVLVCGAGAPVAYHEATQSLQALIPDSMIAFIPDSKVWWQVEGADQVETVAVVLDEFLRKLLRDRKL